MNRNGIKEKSHALVNAAKKKSRQKRTATFITVLSLNADEK
jgi:hypothetical protein